MIPIALARSCFFFVCVLVPYICFQRNLPPRWPSGKAPPREWKIPGSNHACAGIFSGSSHTSDFKIGTPVATPPGAWRYRASAGTGRPGVSIL